MVTHTFTCGWFDVLENVSPRRRRYHGNSGSKNRRPPWGTGAFG